jgi:predicted dehydrogenase
MKDATIENYNWLLIGPGDIAKDFVNDLKLVQNGTHQVVAVVGKTIESAEEFSKALPNARAYDNLEQALTESKIDAAYISTPHPLHYKESIACLNHKVAVLCEKPAALNLTQLEEIIHAAKENQTFFMEGMWIRFLPVIKKVIEILDSKKLGNINSISADMSYKAPYQKENRYFNPKLGGGSLLDLGVYGIFLAHTLLGYPEQIHAHAKLTSENIDESSVFILMYPQGSYALMESSFIKQTQMDAFIYADNGFIKIRSPWMAKSPGIIFTMYDAMDKPEEINFDWEGRGFQFEIEAMVTAIEQNKIETDELSFQTSINMMKITEQIKSITGIKYIAHGE